MGYRSGLRISKSYDATNNRTLVTAMLTIWGSASQQLDGGGWNYAFTNWNVYGQIIIDGNVSNWSNVAPNRYFYLNTKSFSDATVVNTEETKDVFSHSVWINHNGDGSRSPISVTGYFQGSGLPSPPKVSTSATVYFDDAGRPPLAANKPSISRDGQNITMSTSASVPSGAPAIDYYHWYHSTDGINFSYLSQQPASWTWTGSTATQSYWFRAYPHSSEGFAPFPTPVNTSDRVYGAPSKPSPPTLTRTNGIVNLQSNGNSTDGLGINYYQYRYSTDESLWTTTAYTTTSSWTGISLTATQTYYFQTRAYNSSGWGPWSDSATSYGTPTTPSSISTNSPAGLKITVTAGASVGTNITQYYVSASPDNGATWQADIAMGLDRVYEYSNLAGGKNHKFRVRSVNDIGYSEYVYTGTIFIPAGGKRWTGTNWQPTATARRWNGTGWEVITIAKRWNGSSWEVLT